MALTRREVESVAALSRLQLDEQSLEKMTAQLSQVLEYVGQLNELDTDGIAPVSHPGAIGSIFRDDLPVDSLSREDALRNAPDSAEGFFRVPRVIE